MTTFLLMGVTAAITWALTNAYWTDRNQTEITDLWTAFYKEMQQTRTKERMRIESLRPSEDAYSEPEGPGSRYVRRDQK
nr:MAG TPA: membrane protein [Caudoviricetes sp.]